MLSAKYKNLCTNVALFAINALATKFVSFLLVPLYTAYMSAGEYGLTDMSITVISLLTPLVTLSVSDAVIRFIVDDRDNEGVYAFIGFLITSLSVVTVMLFTPLLNLEVFGGLGTYSYWFVFAYASSAFLQYCGSVARGMGKIRIIPICAGISSAITCILAFLLIGRFRLSVVGYFVSVSAGPLTAVSIYLFFGGILRSVVSGFYIVRKSEMSTERLLSLVIPMLRYALPLIPNSIFWWMSTSINRFFITGMIGIASSGLFAAASKMPALLNTAYSIFQQAWQLSSFQESKSNDISVFYSNVFGIVQATMSVLCGMIIYFSPLIGLVMLRGESYASWPMMSILVLANLMNVFNSFYGTVYTSTMNTSYIMTTTIYGAVCCVIATPVLIRCLGVRGACIASVIGQGLVFVMRANKSRKFIAFDSKIAHLVPTLAVLTVQALFTSFQVVFWREVSGICCLIVICIQLHSIIGVLRLSVIRQID